MSNNKLNILIAYPYLKKEELLFLKKNSKHINILIDSGAFTAWKQGLKITTDEYADFIESLPFTPWGYFTLDKIGDPEGSYINYKELKKRKLNPIPIFTRGEKLEMLEQYYKESDFIAIGGLVGTKGNRGFVNGIMKEIKNRKVHWLGFTSQDFLLNYKPYSCDSSGWASGLLYGQLKLYDSAGKHHIINRSVLQKKISPRISWLIQNIYNANPERLKNKDEWVNKMGKSLLRELTFKSSVRYQLDITKKTGINYFLAIANVGDLNSTLDAYLSIKDNI
jgi:hypothetical protein